MNLRGLVVLSSLLCVPLVAGCTDDTTGNDDEIGDADGSGTDATDATDDAEESGTDDGTTDGTTDGTDDGTTDGTTDDGTTDGTTDDGTTDGTTDDGTTDDGTTDGTDDGTDTDTETDTEGTGGEDDCLEPGGDCCPPNPDADATLSGTVWAPNGTIPVSGALVYTTDTAPAGIPDHVYCSECVELTCGDEDYTETLPDGTFNVQAESGDKYLVVRKGEFMRVTPIQIDPGAQMLPDNLTELPGEWDPGNGLYMPRIAVANGSYDRIEDALGKMGMADTDIGNFVENTIPGTENFVLYDNGRDPGIDGFTSQGTMAQLISDPNELAQYHIIFVPCSTDSFISDLTPQNIENIRAWVEEGGRWYVADWAAEWLQLVFPEYQTFYGGNDPDLGAYDSLADVLDDGLLTWLESMPAEHQDINPFNDEPHPTLFDLPQVNTVDNWSGIQYPLPEILVDDGMGNMVNVGHTAWLEGPGGGFDIPVQDIHPLTVTGQYGCGKIQFTSYHTAEFFDYVGLSPQELVLMYTILEIGVCQQDLPPPQ